MTFLVIAALIIAAVVVLRIVSKNARRNEYVRRSAEQPLDPMLAEVYHRTADESDWKARSFADEALREATPHIHRMVTQHGEAAVLVLHQTSSNSYLAKGGLLVVATDRVLLFADGKVTTVSHRSGTSTRINGSGTTFWVDIEGDGSFSYSCDSLKTARLVCSAIDIWAENPVVRYVPGAHVTPTRVDLPVDFFAGVLEASQLPVTPGNLRALQERFGMLLVQYTRGVIDSAHGFETGERFVQQHGRPVDDADLPLWPERVLRAFVALDPDYGHSIGPFLPGKVHSILLERYLAEPGRQLSMWMNDEYENNGTGPRRTAPRDARPPMPA